jgi:large subunit ribosomal protein L32e
MRKTDKVLLEIRKRLKKKKPRFTKQDAHKKAKLSPAWRRPRGSDSKMRRGQRGYRRSVEVGWGSPRQVKGLHVSGLEQVVVFNPWQLSKLDPTQHGIIIGAAVGTKKRVSIAKEAMRKGITILNIKSPQQFLQDVEEKIKKKSEEKKKKLTEKEKAKEKQQEKEKEKEKEKKEKEEAPKDELAEKLEEEDRKKKEKEEMDKLLIKPEK